MEKVKICMIDEEADLFAITRLFGVSPKKANCDEQSSDFLGNRKSSTRLGHGTICEEILIEALIHFNILDCVDLFHFSVGSVYNQDSIEFFLQGLNYCKENEIDLISCSLGMCNRSFAKKMFPILAEMDKPLIIAANANSQKITYPAALPSVLGVKESMDTQHRIIAVKDPYDGIDLVYPFHKTLLFQNSGYEPSNSLVVPQCCAQVAKLALQGVTCDKEHIIDALSNDSCNSFENKPNTFDGFTANETIPIIMFHTSASLLSNRLNVAIQLQTAFQTEGFSCAIMSNYFSSSDFEAGHFRIDTNTFDQDISYFYHATEHDLFLLVSDIESKGKFHSDLCFDDTWFAESKKNVIQDLYETILHTFS